MLQGYNVRNTDLHAFTALGILPAAFPKIRTKKRPPLREAVLNAFTVVRSGNDALLGLFVEEVNAVGVDCKGYDLADLGL